MTPLPLKLRKSLLIRAAIVLVILIAFLFLLFIPQMTKTKTLARVVDNLYFENQHLEELVLSSGHPGERLQSIQNLLQDYREMIPPRSMLSEVLDKVATRAEEDGLEVLSLKPLRNLPYLKGNKEITQTHSEHVYEVMMSMQAKGLFFELGRYLTSLETGPYRILVKHVSLKTRHSGENEGPQEPELQIEIVMGILMKFPIE